MIHTARQSPKFKMFVRAIRPMAKNEVVDVESIAVSILERLWHQTAIGAKQGDIGKFDNELIAEECGWLGDAAWLVDTLVKCRYLDECSQHRLIVHDWSEHAPNHVKGVMKRRAEKGQLGFATRVVNPSSEPKSATQGAKPPNLTNSNLTQPNQTKPKDDPRDDLMAVIPEKFQTEEIRQAVRHWALKRSEGSGDYKKLIGLDAIELQHSLMKFSHMPPGELYAVLANAISGGWKNLHEGDRTKQGSTASKLSPGEQQLANAAGFLSEVSNG